MPFDNAVTLALLIPYIKLRPTMIKDFLMKRGLTLLQDPRVQRVTKDPRVMQGMMRAIQMRGQLQDRVDARLESVAHSLNFATKKELREMKRSMKKMERELSKAKRQAEELKKAQAELAETT